MSKNITKKILPTPDFWKVLCVCVCVCVYILYIACIIQAVALNTISKWMNVSLWESMKNKNGHPLIGDLPILHHAGPQGHLVLDV